MAWQQVAAAAVKQAIKSAPVKNGAAAAGATVAAGVTALLGKETVEGIQGHVGKRRNHRMAIDLARQVGGKYSENTVVAGRRRFVVWKDAKPIASFPTFDAELAERDELREFPDDLLKHPPASGY